MDAGDTYLHVIQPVLTFLDPFLPDWCGCPEADAGESESSPILRRSRVWMVWWRS
jgi:hypothetical protein